MKFYCVGGLVTAAALTFFGGTFSAVGYGDDTSDSTSSVAAPAVNGGTSTEAVAPPAPTSKVFGTLDLRAEYYNNTTIYDTSNFAQLGYQINPNFLISWYQGFDSNINNAILNNKPASGLNGILDQGFLRTRVNKIWESADKSWAFNFENRIYVPTWGFDQQMNNIVRAYNAFKLAKKVNDTLSFTGVFIVMPEVFSTAGTMALGPNPAYEQRYYLVADINITSKLSLDFPILLYQTKYRTYAANPVSALTQGSSGDWGYFLYIWPELDYAITDNFTVGLAYVSGNMVKPDFSGVTLKNAFATGIYQLVFTTTL